MKLSTPEKVLDWTHEKLNFTVSVIMVQNSMMQSFSARASYAVKCLQQQPTIWFETRDENDVPRVPIVSLLLYYLLQLTVH